MGPKYTSFLMCVSSVKGDIHTSKHKVSTNYVLKIHVHIWGHLKVLWDRLGHIFLAFIFHVNYVTIWGNLLLWFYCNLKSSTFYPICGNPWFGINLDICNISLYSLKDYSHSTLETTQLIQWPTKWLLRSIHEPQPASSLDS